MHRESARTQRNSSPQWRCTVKGEGERNCLVVWWWFCFFLLKFQLPPPPLLLLTSSILSSARSRAVPSQIPIHCVATCQHCNGRGVTWRGSAGVGSVEKNWIRLKKYRFCCRTSRPFWYQRPDLILIRCVCVANLQFSCDWGMARVLCVRRNVIRE